VSPLVHGRPQKFFQGVKVDILLIIFRLLTIIGVIDRVQGGEPPPPGKPNVKIGHLLSLYFGYIVLLFFQ